MKDFIEAIGKIITLVAAVLFAVVAALGIGFVFLYGFKRMLIYLSGMS